MTYYFIFDQLSYFLDVDSSTVSSASTFDLKSDCETTPGCAQILKTKIATETTEIKTLFPVASWE